MYKFIYNIEDTPGKLIHTHRHHSFSVNIFLVFLNTQISVERRRVEEMYYLSAPL